MREHFRTIESCQSGQPTHSTGAARADCEALLAEAGGRTWRTAGWDAAVAFEPLGPTQR